MADSKRHKHEWVSHTATHERCAVPGCGKVRRDPMVWHHHDWQPWGADTRYQWCECGEVRRVLADAESEKAEAQR